MKRRESNPPTLEILIAQGRELLQSADDGFESHREFGYWDHSVAEWLDNQFPNSGVSGEWSSLPTSQLMLGKHFYDIPEAWIAFRSAVQKRLAWLGQIGGVLSTAARSTEATKKMTQPSPSNRVFVVHGHNETIREKVARFLEKLQLTPVILHEQPNRGQTIIEKFTDYADVYFAIVLLTADDVGGAKSTSPTEYKPRARQNVIFELGYFLGRLGRAGVCALYESGIEILSDYAGVLYVNIDANGAWQLQLAKEMKAAGRYQWT